MNPSHLEFHHLVHVMPKQALPVTAALSEGLVEILWAGPEVRKAQCLEVADCPQVHCPC